MYLRGRLKRLRQKAEEGGVIIRQRDGGVRVFDTMTVFSEMFLAKMDLLRDTARDSEVLDAVRTATPESRADFEKRFGPIAFTEYILGSLSSGGWVEAKTLTADGWVERILYEGHSKEATLVREGLRAGTASEVPLELPRPPVATPCPRGVGGGAGSGVAVGAARPPGGGGVGDPPAPPPLRTLVRIMPPRGCRQTGGFHLHGVGSQLWYIYYGVEELGLTHLRSLERLGRFLNSPSPASFLLSAARGCRLLGSEGLARRSSYKGKPAAEGGMPPVPLRVLTSKATYNKRASERSTVVLPCPSPALPPSESAAGARPPSECIDSTAKFSGQDVPRLRSTTLYL